jgi:hypothetical protein
VASISTDATNAKLLIMVLFPCVLPIAQSMAARQTPTAVILIWAFNFLTLLNSASERRVGAVGRAPQVGWTVVVAKMIY